MNKPLFGLGVSLAAFAVFLLWSVAAVAQDEVDVYGYDFAPVYLLEAPTRTTLSPTPSGTAWVLMQQEQYVANMESAGDGSPDWRMAGYVWDAGWPLKQGIRVLPVAYLIANGGTDYIERICNVKLYYIDTDQAFVDADMPVYAFADEYESCPGPIPLFEGTI